MSDSSKEASKVFEASILAMELSKNKVVAIKHTQVAFEKGWLEIFEEFIESVENYKVFIKKADDEFNFLDIEVDLSSTGHEREIYKAILKAKYFSLRTCSNCSREKYPDGSSKYCSQCVGTLSKKGNTGTWLDDYIG